MLYRDLTIEDTTFFKGITILLIVLHNFFRKLSPYIGENEQYFDFNNIKRFTALVINEPLYSFQAFFSFLGHYGVQVFLFLSAYGLTKKYLNSTVTYGYFLQTRFKKIYPVFILSVLFWAFYVGLKYGGPLQVICDHWESLWMKLLLISNFVPGELYTINGPWWFLSLIFQFYILFPLLLKIENQYGYYILLMLSFFSLLLSYLLQPYLDIRLGGTVFMHLPELTLGIIFAKRGEVKIPLLFFGALIVIFILSNYYLFFWYFSYISIVLILLLVIQGIYTYSDGLFKSIIMLCGSLSMYIFFIHGFLRNPWIGFAEYFTNWYMNIFFCMIFVSAVLISSVLMKKIHQLLLNRK